MIGIGLKTLNLCKFRKYLRNYGLIYKMFEWELRVKV